MGKLARTGVFCLMGLAICLARLVEVEFKSEMTAPPAATIAAEPTAQPQPAPVVPPKPVVLAPTPVAEPPVPRTYVVQGGDQLRKISRAVYGTTRHWKLIYRANRTVIPNPDTLKLGETLIIPRLPVDR